MDCSISNPCTQQFVKSILIRNVFTLSFFRFFNYFLISLFTNELSQNWMAIDYHTEPDFSQYLPSIPKKFFLVLCQSFLLLNLDGIQMGQHYTT